MEKLELISEEINKLSSKFDELKNVIDKLVNLRTADTTEIEIASAKTISDITSNISKITTTCNKTRKIK